MSDGSASGGLILTLVPSGPVDQSVVSWDVMNELSAPGRLDDHAS